MKRTHKIVFTAVSGALAILAVAAVTAHPFTPHTPLYTMRMEQVSSEMNFLPTEVNNFTYAAEKGHEFNYEALGVCCGVLNEPTIPLGTCCYQLTCRTCEETCEGETCQASCWSTCNTCEPTCEEPTCLITCEHTCPYTCEKPCQP